MLLLITALVIASVETCKFQQKQHMQVSTKSNSQFSEAITNSSTKEKQKQWPVLILVIAVLISVLCWNLQVLT